MPDENPSLGDLVEASVQGVLVPDCTEPAEVLSK